MLLPSRSATQPRDGIHHVSCNLCEAICGLRLTIADGAVTGVRGDPADPLSRGHVCPKGVAIADVLTDPERLRRPVRRRGPADDPQWEELGWDEALDLVADRLAETVERHGRDSLAVYLGNPNVHSLGSMTHGTELAKALPTRNRFSATSVDQLPAQLVASLMYGHQLLLPVPDLDRTDLLLAFGYNPMASNGSLMTVPDFPARLRELQGRGGRLVVLDPRRTETAKVADQHLFVRPGTDVHVLLAMVHVLLAEDLATPPPYVAGLDKVRAAVADRTPEAAEAASGVPAETIRALVRELAGAERAAVHGRIGVSTTEFGTLAQWAIQLLNLLTGNLDRVGGTMLTSPAIDVVGRGLIGPGHRGVWHSRVRGLPETAGELPVAALREEIETPGEGQVRALLTMSGNPVLSTPDGAGLDRVLPSLDFMAAIDFYVNETTRHADVILPPTSHLERDHYDLVFHALAVRNTARFSPAVFRKSSDQRHDWQIYAGLVRRLAARSPRRLPWRRRAVRWARMRTSPARVVSMLLRTSRTGVTLRALRRAPSGVDLGPLQPDQLPGRLRTGDGLVQAAPELVLADLDRLGSARAPEPGTLLLIGRRHQRDNNSWMHNAPRLTKGRARHHLLMHPDDLASRGLTDQSLVRVTSRVGEVVVEVSASTDMMPGVVSLPHGYGHGRPGTAMSTAAQVPGVSVNDLTDPLLLDVSGNAALSGVPVTVTCP
ncbi:molybdopterin-dependent oxidoreductase [Nocardioides campestrisoli]|uniref:molybdopterin-dependent oxidoreductase n=1 Tax=Nocardioides campestrisoli TaxID=2736757 RepID=UPI00163D6AE6|nr:molybdopterin-dependent oxidoreductase [Nocardioides campestrisoli]